METATYHVRKRLFDFEWSNQSLLNPRRAINEIIYLYLRMIIQVNIIIATTNNPRINSSPMGSGFENSIKIISIVTKFGIIVITAESAAGADEEKRGAFLSLIFHELYCSFSRHVFDIYFNQAHPVPIAFDFSSSFLHVIG